MPCIHRLGKQPQHVTSTLCVSKCIIIYKKKKKKHSSNNFQTKFDNLRKLVCQLLIILINLNWIFIFANVSFGRHRDQSQDQLIVLGFFSGELFNIAVYFLHNFTHIIENSMYQWIFFHLKRNIVYLKFKSKQIVKVSCNTIDYFLYKQMQICCNFYIVNIFQQLWYTRICHLKRLLKSFFQGSGWPWMFNFY